MSDGQSPLGRLVERSARLPAVPESFSRYDAVLVALPLLYAAALGAATVAPVSVRYGLVAGGVAGTVLIGDALFRNPPDGS